SAGDRRASLSFGAGNKKVLRQWEAQQVTQQTHTAESACSPWSVLAVDWRRPKTALIVLEKYAYPLLYFATGFVRLDPPEIDL
ncbi:unnamed protein product, partial [Ectocarpus sp. 12 AP-2014]